MFTLLVSHLITSSCLFLRLLDSLPSFRSSYTSLDPGFDLFVKIFPMMIIYNITNNILTTGNAHLKFEAGVSLFLKGVDQLSCLEQPIFFQNKPQPTFSLRKATCKKIISGCDKMPPRPGPGSWKRWHQGPPLHGNFKYFQLLFSEGIPFFEPAHVCHHRLVFCCALRSGRQQTYIGEQNSNWRPE